MYQNSAVVGVQYCPSSYLSQNYHDDAQLLQNWLQESALRDHGGGRGEGGGNEPFRGAQYEQIQVTKNILYEKVGGI